MELLADYSPAMLHRWQSLDFMLAWCARVQPLELEHFPEPVIDVVLRAEVEAETGELPPDEITRIRIDLARLPETPEAELVEYLRSLEMRPEEYCLPWPYSVALLQQTKGTTGPCMYLAGKLRRGEITEAEHAAELAKFLPVVTRADQEQAVRTNLERLLEYSGPAEGSAQAAATTENATETAPGAECSV